VRRLLRTGAPTTSEGRGSRARLVGALILLLALAGWLAAYIVLTAARGSGLQRDTFGLGLFAALLVFLPLAAAGVFLIVRGAPDADLYRARRSARRAIGEAEQGGWSNLWRLLEETGLTRDEASAHLAHVARERAFRGYADWSRGVLAAASHAEGCPACGSPSQLPEGRRVCPECRVERLPG
jgi:hypothetical protein